MVEVEDETRQELFTIRTTQSFELKDKIEQLWSQGWFFGPWANIYWNDRKSISSQAMRHIPELIQGDESSEAGQKAVEYILSA